MSQILNATPETLGVGAIVKFNSPCPVIATLIKGDARLSMGSVSGKATFTVVTPGDYEFKATCDCGASYTVMFAGDVDPSTTECCVNPLTNPAGELLGIEIGGDEFFSPATSGHITYTWVETNPVDGDGVVEWTGTPSDGSTPQVISLAEPTVDSDTVFTGMTVDPVTGIVTQTFEDADGNPLPSQTADLSALISTGHPVLAGAGSTTVAFDTPSNTWTVTGAEDTDTSVVIINNADGSQSLQNVDIDGNNVGTPVNIGKPYDDLLDCNGDVIAGGLVTCGPNDYIHTAMLPMGEATLIAPLNNDNLCDTPLVSLVSGSENNVSVALNADGTHTVTAIGDACADGTWSYDYETVCNGETQTATVSGYVDNAVQTHAFSAANETTVNLALVLASGGDYDIDWGDGVVDTVASGTAANTHVYAAPYTGDVNVSFPSCSGITEFRSTAGHWNFDIGTLPSTLTYYYNAGQNTTSGDIGTLPSTLTYYSNTGQNTTSGDIGTLPSTLTYYYNAGQNTVTALTTNWSAPATMRYFLQHGAANTATEVDNMLVALASNVTSWTIERTVSVAGSNASPSATGTSAIPAISAAGATTILTN